jgi:hypothetical protein
MSPADATAFSYSVTAICSAIVAISKILAAGVTSSGTCSTGGTFPSCSW